MSSRTSVKPPLAYAQDASHLLCLNAAETASSLPYAALVEAIALAAGETRRGAIAVPERTVVPLRDSATLLCMPAVAADLAITKLITVHPDNSRRNLKTIQGEVIVIEAETGRRLVVLDGPTLTARRTAAVTLAGLRALHPAPIRSVLLIGAGEQAEAHLEALAEVEGVTRFCIASPGRRRADRLAGCMAAFDPGLHITTADTALLPADEIEAADAIIALTTATRPVIPAGIPDSAIVVGVGAYRPNMVEIPADLVRRRRIVVDHLASARAEAGDLIQAGIAWDGLEELADVLDAAAPAGPCRPVLFKTVGHASWDLAAARVAVQSLGRVSTN